MRAKKILQSKHLSVITTIDDKGTYHISTQKV